MRNVLAIVVKSTKNVAGETEKATPLGAAP